MYSVSRKLTISQNSMKEVKHIKVNLLCIRQHYVLFIHSGLLNAVSRTPGARSHCISPGAQINIQRLIWIYNISLFIRKNWLFGFNLILKNEYLNDSSTMRQGCEASLYSSLFEGIGKWKFFKSNKYQKLYLVISQIKEN